MTVFYHLVIVSHMDSSDIPTELPTDGGQHTFETESGKRPASIAIVESIAAIEGVHPTDVDFSLYESIDPDALDTLFANPEDDEETAGEDKIVAEFQTDGYVVQIRENGKIMVKALDQSE